MSTEAIKFAMENRTALPPDELSAADLREAGCMEKVCVLPEQFNERIRYVGNLLVQMLTKKPEDDDLRFVVGQVSQTLSYILNSTSWQDEKLHDFDLDEIRRKVGRLGKGGEERTQRQGE